MKTILVTGGTGYIGSHTVVELQQSGFDVIIADNLSNSDIRVLDRISDITGIKPAFEQFDLCEKQLTEKFFRLNKDIDAVIHFAAYKSVGESVKDPLKYYYNNLVSLINLLENLISGNIKNLVYSSSCTLYGQPDILPVTENSPLKKAMSPYGNTKKISEEIIQDAINKGNNLKAISLRYFNPIGAHKSSLIGELPIGTPDNLVPYITQTAIGKREQLRIFGNDYNTPDGTCIRDYIHVVDLAKAHVAALNKMAGEKNDFGFEVYNLGTGKGYSVMEVINTFVEVTGTDLNYIFTDRRPGDVEQVFSDTKKANRELGWKAEKTLGDMLLSAWNWEKQYNRNNPISKNIL